MKDEKEVRRLLEDETKELNRLLTLGREYLEQLNEYGFALVSQNQVLCLARIRTYKEILGEYNSTKYVHPLMQAS